jgi:hypothetical protein
VNISEASEAVNKMYGKLNERNVRHTFKISVLLSLVFSDLPPRAANSCKQLNQRPYAADGWTLAEIGTLQKN